METLAQTPLEAELMGKREPGNNTELLWKKWSIASESSWQKSSSIKDMILSATTISCHCFTPC